MCVYPGFLHAYHRLKCGFPPFKDVRNRVPRCLSTRSVVGSGVVAGGGFPGPQAPGPEALLNHRPLGYEPSGLPGCPTPLPSSGRPAGLIKRIDIAGLLASAEGPLLKSILFNAVLAPRTHICGLPVRGPGRCFCAMARKEGTL